MNKTIRVSDLNTASKKYVIWVRGFYYYAGGITGVTRWSSLKILNGTGWDSRPEAQNWCKETCTKSYNVPAKDPYGTGAKCQKVQIIRLDKFFKYINSEESWYERRTCTIPTEATIV